MDGSPFWNRKQISTTVHCPFGILYCLGMRNKKAHSRGPSHDSTTWDTVGYSSHGVIYHFSTSGWGTPIIYSSARKPLRPGQGPSLTGAGELGGGGGEGWGGGWGGGGWGLLGRRAKPPPPNQKRLLQFSQQNLKTIFQTFWGPLLALLL